MIHPPRRRPVSRHQRDARIGYGALALSALAFVVVLIASFVVLKAAPGDDRGAQATLTPAQVIAAHPLIRLVPPGGVGSVPRRLGHP